LVSVSEEQLEVLGDDELALVINRFSRFHNNRMNRRRGGQKEGCFGYGGLDHFIAHYPNKDKHQPTKPKDKRENTYAKHKDKCNYSSNKHKSKGKMDKETLKKAKIRACTFLASLSDIEADSKDHESCSSDDESEKKIMEQLNRLCFVAESTHGGFCTMALGDEEIGKDKAPDDECASQVSLSFNELSDEIDKLNAALANQDKLLRLAVRERKEYMAKLEVVLKELGIAKSAAAVSDEV
jgi:hypothetical protein